MATRSGRPMLNDEDPHYTTRTMHLTTRCQELRNKMEAWVKEHGATMTPEQRRAHLISQGYWNLFIYTRNWDQRQQWLPKAHAAYLEFEALVQS